jgi:uncharacterized protein YlxW (UPF0749 family)
MEHKRKRPASRDEMRLREDIDMHIQDTRQNKAKEIKRLEKSIKDITRQLKQGD